MSSAGHPSLPTSPPLQQVQEWMQAVIMHPDGIAAGIRSPQACRAIPVATEQVEQVITRSRQLTAVDRLAVYGHAYVARLLECLQEEFPATRQAVGERAFQAFVFGYLQVYPSRSDTLADLGANFPRYLQESRPASETTGDAADWSDFVLDLARLERLYAEVFDGPGPEQMTLLTSEDLQAIAPTEFGSARLQTVPSLRVVDFKFPVHEYITSVRRGNTEVPFPAARPTCLVVTRRDYICRRGTVTPVQGAILRTLIAGQTVAQALAAAVKTPGADPADLMQNVGTWFETWARANYFAAVYLDH